MRQLRPVPQNRVKNGVTALGVRPLVGRAQYQQRIIKSALGAGTSGSVNRRSLIPATLCGMVNAQQRATNGSSEGLQSGKLPRGAVIVVFFGQPSGAIKRIHNDQSKALGCGQVCDFPHRRQPGFAPQALEDKPVRPVRRQEGQSFAKCSDFQFVIEIQHPAAVGGHAKERIAIGNRQRQCQRKPCLGSLGGPDHGCNFAFAQQSLYNRRIG